MAVAWIRFFVLPALAACCPASAGDCAPPTVLLNALDHDGRIEAGLTAADFRVEVSGKAIPISSIVVDRNPRQVALMLDASGSVSGARQNFWGIVLATAAFAVDTLPPNSTAALAIFARNLQRESPKFESRDAVGDRVLGLKKRKPFGPTNLYHSIQDVVDQFAELRLGDSIYLVTDGADNSKTPRAEVTRALIAHGIRVFVFLVQDESFRTEEQRMAPAEMEEMAQATGGALITISPAQLAPGNRAALDKLGRRIADQAAGFYRLEIGITPPEKPAHVKVKLVNRDRAKTVQTLAYPHEITTCPR